MATKAQIKAVAKYDKKNSKTYAIKLNRTTDADIIDVLESVDNKQGYIKSAIRKDIATRNLSDNLK